MRLLLGIELSLLPLLLPLFERVQDWVHPQEVVESAFEVPKDLVDRFNPRNNVAHVEAVVSNQHVGIYKSQDIEYERIDANKQVSIFQVVETFEFSKLRREDQGGEAHCFSLEFYLLHVVRGYFVNQ